MTAQDLLQYLHGVKGRDGQWTAKCPAHADGHNSLSVSIGRDGRALLKCHAGCTTEAITAALGLSVKDLFVEDVTPAPKSPIVATYDIRDTDGTLLCQKQRRADKSFTWRRPDGKGGWIYNRQGVPHRLYSTGKISGSVIVTEGEKDADTVYRLMGITAVSGADGAGPGKWKPEYTEQLKGCSVCVFGDNDAVGKAYQEETCNALLGAASSVKLCDLSTVWPEVPEHGDVTDMVNALGEERAIQNIATLVSTSPDWRGKTSLLAPMSSVEAKRASYLITPYLPKGMLAILGGVSGVGKTYLILSWAAAISNGQKLSFMENTPAPGYVYYFTQENDPNVVIRPRLDVLGANLDRILIQADGIEPLTMNDPRLEDAAKVYPPAMIIFDPIQSYLGSGVEMNKANEVRPVLDWMGDYAKRHSCTIVLVSHMSKPGVGNPSALDRLLGSSDFRNAARSIIVVGRDPEDPETRIFAHGKNSIGEPGASQKYHITNHGVVYDGPTDLDADDIVKQAARSGRDKPAVSMTEAMTRLEDLLGEQGAATVEDVELLQTAAGISQRTMYNAKKELNLRSVSLGKPPNRKTWWLQPWVDVDFFKLSHTTEQIEMEEV